MTLDRHRTLGLTVWVLQRRLTDLEWIFEIANSKSGRSRQVNRVVSGRRKRRKSSDA
jgi:hypothetical protein